MRKWLRILFAFVVSLGLLSTFALVVMAYEYHIVSNTWQLDLAASDSCEIGTEAACSRWRLAGDASEWTYQFFTLPVTATGISVRSWKSEGGGTEILAGGCPGAQYTEHYSYYFTAIWTGCNVSPGETYIAWRNNTSQSNHTIEVYEITYQSDYRDVGGNPPCAAVEDADFETGTPWTLSGGASITGSVLSLDYTGAYAQQDFAILAQTYTVTVRARRTSSGSTDGLVVGLYSEAVDRWAATDPIGLTDEWATVETTIEPWATGDGSLRIISNGIHEVDYICLTPIYGGSQTCTSEGRAFDFSDGYNTDPFGMSGGFSQHWQGIDYPLGGYPGATPRWADGKFWNDKDIASDHDALTIKYDYLVVPSVITITEGYNLGSSTVWVQALTSEDGNTWSVATEQAVATGDNVVSLTLDYGSPVYVAVAVLVDSQPLAFMVPGLIQLSDLEMDACYRGPNNFAGCVFGDPDFDLADGLPSRFYWDGIYTPGDGVAVLDTDGFVSQDITPPAATDYILAITADSSNTPTSCAWSVKFTTPGLLNIVEQATVPCGQGVNHVYTPTVSLPAQPVSLWIEQISGASSISRVCLQPAAGTSLECLNPNPDMQLSTGYFGNYNRSLAGTYQVQEGGKILATGVTYSGSPYLLEAIINPITSGDTPTVTITTGGIPGAYDGDQSVTISNTTYITYPLYSEIPGNFGPTIWNLGDGGVQVLRYCIKPNGGGVITDTPPVDYFMCETVTNADFENGLTGWDYDNVLAVNSLASFGYDAYVAQNLGELGGTTAVVRWLASSFTGEITATLQVNDQTVTRTFNNQALFIQDEFEITNTTAITVSATKSGLNLDFICLYPLDSPTYQPPPPGTVDTDTGEIVIPPGGHLAQCVAPPMGILPDSITDTLQTLWPWGGSMTNYEVLMAYNTSWVRYIGCSLDSYITWFKDVFWGEPWRFGFGGDGLRAKLDQIIFLLGLLNLLELIQAVQAALELLETVVKGVAEIAEKIGTIVVGIVTIVAIVLSILWMVAAFVFTLFAKLMYALANPCSDVTLGTNNYAILAGWQFTQDAIAATPLKYLTLIAANVLIFKFFNWVASLFK